MSDNYGFTDSGQGNQYLMGVSDIDFGPMASAKHFCVSYRNDPVAEQPQAGPRDSWALASSFYPMRKGGEKTTIVYTRYEQGLELEGDWRKEYSELVPKGLRACIGFYEIRKAIENKGKISIQSSPIDAPEGEDLQ